MRNLVVAPIIVATLLLAACGAPDQSSGESATSGPSAAPSAAATPASAATAVTGTITVENPPTPITAQATLELSLVDMSKSPGVTINKQDFAPPTFPQAFHIPFSASAINPNDLYVLQATMQDGGRTYSTKLQQPVLTRGTPAKVDLTMVAEPTAAEKMLADFATAKRQTGAMKVNSGTSAKIGESRSWQVFSDLSGVEFIIQQVNHADTGFTKTEYAYRDGAPFVVVQSQSATPTGAPTSVERAGWNGDGVLVLNQKQAGDKTDTLSDAEAKALHQESEAEYKKFKNTK